MFKLIDSIFGTSFSSETSPSLKSNLGKLRIVEKAHGGFIVERFHYGAGYMDDAHFYWDYCGLFKTLEAAEKWVADEIKGDRVIG